MSAADSSKTDKDIKAQIKIGHYVLKETLGLGTFGKVKGRLIFAIVLIIKRIDI